MSALRLHFAPSSLEDDNLLRGLRLLAAAHGFEELPSLDELPVNVLDVGWDELAGLTLPVLALGEDECFLIKRAQAGVAMVCYPLIGDLLLLRPWLEERWSGKVVVVEPEASRAAGSGRP